MDKIHVLHVMSQEIVPKLHRTANPLTSIRSNKTDRENLKYLISFLKAGQIWGKVS